MVTVGSPFDLPLLRAIARFVFFAIPAWILIRKLEPDGADVLGMFTNLKRGLAVGFVVSLVWGAIHSWQHFEVPWTIHAWLNVIVLSPIAEELLFRRAAIEYGLTKTNAAITVIASAILFALVHVPWWMLSGEKTLAQISLLLATMFAYGLVFGTLYYRTRSIWSSLIPHSVNNLIAVSLVR